MTLVKLIRLIFAAIILVSVAIAIIHPDHTKEAIDANNLGHDQSVQGDFDNALVNYNKAIELDPTNSIFYYNRAETRLHKGDAAGAMADFNKAIEINPQYSDALSQSRPRQGPRRRLRWRDG